MKLVIVAVLAIAAVAAAKFQFPEEWELWKKVGNTVKKKGRVYPKVVGHQDLDPLMCSPLGCGAL